MKAKSVALLLLLVFAVTEVSASPAVMKKRRRRKSRKEVAFKQGQVLIQPAAGFIVNTDYSKTDYSLYGTLAYKKSFPFYFRAEYGVAQTFGLGAYFGSFKEKVTITDVTVPTNIYGFDHSYKSFGIRGSYHQKLETPKLDPYAGLMVGATTVKTTAFGELNYTQPMSKAGLGFSVYAGANFYFSKYIGVFVEGGYSKWLPMLQTGLAVKF